MFFSYEARVDGWCAVFKRLGDDIGLLGGHDGVDEDVVEPDTGTKVPDGDSGTTKTLDDSWFSGECSHKARVHHRRSV